MTLCHYWCQWAPNHPPECSQPCLSRSRCGHPLRDGANLGAFVPVWLALGTVWGCDFRGVFDLCHFDLLKRGCVNFQDPDSTPTTNICRFSIWFCVGEVILKFRIKWILTKETCFPLTCFPLNRDGVEVQKNAPGAVFALTRFCSVRISIRDLLADRNPY